MKSALLFAIAVFFFMSLHAECRVVPKKEESNLPVLTTANSTNGRFDIITDVFYWYAQEIGADIWGTEQVEGSPIFDPEPANGKKRFQFKQPFFDWNVGIRTGIGYRTDYDSWDTQLYYTWYQTSASGQVNLTSGDILSSFFGSFFAVLLNYPYTSSSLKWTLLVNMFDWELGRNCPLSSEFALRPFLGLKGGWIHQNIYTHWQSSTITAQENLKNRFYGIGPSGGVKTEWKLAQTGSHKFSLLGKVAGSFMWGFWKFFDEYIKNTIKQNYPVGLQNQDGLTIWVQTFLGTEWNYQFNKGNSAVTFGLGYEAQFWLDQLQFLSYDMGRLNGVLTLQGGTFDCRFDF